MKRKIFFVLALFFFAFNYVSFSQVQEKGTPLSFKANLDVKGIEKVELKAPNVDSLLADDVKRAQEGVLYRVGVALKVNLNPSNSGTWTTLPSGQRIWRLRISSKGAEALVLNFNEFYLPLEAKMFVYSIDKKQVIGAFTSKNNKEDHTFATRMVLSDDIIIELDLPTKMVGNYDLSIFNVGYIYRNTETFLWKGPKPAGSCEVNVNCSPEGDDWQDEKRGVARILLKAGSQYGYCSGTLINNTRNDCTPYFLSASHCAEESNDDDFAYWTFYFNYEAATCSGTTGPDDQTVVGCEKIAQALNNAGTTSDMLLLKFTSSVPESYNPYFNGWDRNSTIPSNAVGIHHPAGDIKKISYGYNISNYYNTHMKIYWEETQNGHGVTEGGSSGSPLFDKNSGLVIGTLTGGTSGCDNLTGYDIYGRVYFHWDQNGSTNDVQLKPWLDPDNTGVTSLQGTYCGNVAPTANFSADNTTVLVGGTVNFTDLSSGNPTSWSWNFGDGGTSTQQNPSHVYSSVGDYTVSLTVSNANGSDTETKNAYIHVVNQVTECDTLNYPLNGTPTLYQSSNGGYLLGNNGYGDKAKAQYFTLPAGLSKFSKVFFWFGQVSDGGNSTQVSFKVWADNNGTIGNEIASTTIPISSIKSDFDNQQMTAVTFTPEINLTGNFYVGLILPTGNGDTLALVSNKDGDATSPEVAWEQWSDDTWHSVAEQNAWNVSIAAGIFPIVCPEGTDVEWINDNEALAIYPNPTNGKFKVKYISDYTGNLTVKVVNVDGKILFEKTYIKSTKDFEKDFKLDLPEGMYSLMLQTDNEVSTHKLIVK